MGPAGWQKRHAALEDSNRALEGNLGMANATVAELQHQLAVKTDECKELEAQLEREAEQYAAQEKLLAEAQEVEAALNSQLTADAIEFLAVCDDLDASRRSFRQAQTDLLVVG